MKNDEHGEHELGVEVEAIRADLSATVRDALAAVDRAERDLAGLVGDLFDTEYLAGGVGQDAQAFLADAARFLRAVDAINQRVADP